MVLASDVWKPRRPWSRHDFGNPKFIAGSWKSALRGASSRAGSPFVASTPERLSPTHLLNVLGVCFDKSGHNKSFTARCDGVDGKRNHDVMALCCALKRDSRSFRDALEQGDWKGVGTIFNLAIEAVPGLAAFEIDEDAVASDLNHPLRMLAWTIGFDALDVSGLYEHVAQAKHAPPAVNTYVVVAIEAAVRKARLAEADSEEVLDVFNAAVKAAGVDFFSQCLCTEAEKELVAAVAQDLREFSDSAGGSVDVRSSIRLVLSAVVARCGGACVGTLTMMNEQWFTDMIKQPSDLKTWERANDTVFVRAIHEEIWDLLVSTNRGMVLLGNPCIGKSWALNYLLYMAVRSKRPVFLWAVQGLLAFLPYGTVLFSERVDDQPPKRLVRALVREFSPHGKDAALFLYDLRADTAVSMDVPNMLTVIATSLQEGTYKGVLKYDTLACYYMPPWSQGEFEAFHLTDSTNAEKAVAVKDAFVKYGGVVRGALDADQQSKVDAAIKKVTFSQLVGFEFHDGFSHKIICQVPKGRRNSDYQLEFRTEYIERLFAEGQRQLIDSQLVGDLVLSLCGPTRPLCSVIFEVVMIHFAHLLPFHEAKAPQDPATNAHPFDERTGSAVLDFVHRQSCLKTAMLETPDDHQWRLYAPHSHSDNFPVFDAFLVRRKRGAVAPEVFGVQITIGEPHVPTAKDLSSLEAKGISVAPQVGSICVSGILWIVNCESKMNKAQKNPSLVHWDALPQYMLSVKMNEFFSRVRGPRQ